MKKLILGTVIAALTTAGAYAEDYQFELGAAYITGDLSGVDYDGFGFSGEAHFDKVDTSKGPLNEAAFLDKSSFVVARWLTLEADFPGAEAADNIALEGRFVVGSDWIIEADFNDLDGDETILGVGIGRYLNDTTDLVVSYEQYDEADSSSLGADIHSLHSLTGGTALAYDAGISYLDSGDENGYELRGGVDYYFNKSVSVGAGLSLASIDEEDVSTLGLRVNYFVAPSIKLSAEVESLGQDADGDAIMLSGAVRF
jgi:opacity protein-like surface antigen